MAKLQIVAPRQSNIHVILNNLDKIWESSMQLTKVPSGSDRDKESIQV